MLILLIVALGVGGWYGFKWYTTGEKPPVPIPLAAASESVDETPVSDLLISQHVVDELKPRYIRIDSLNLPNTRVQPVNLDENNLLAYTANIHDAGWYEKSNTPGSGGVILIDGRSIGNTSSGPFKGLYALKFGSKIVLERGDGMIYSYSVVENKDMTIEDVNMTGMTDMTKSAKPGVEALNIITDSGSWVPKLGMFDRRIMLRSILVN
jgi:hypothetical protein